MMLPQFNTIVSTILYVSAAPACQNLYNLWDDPLVMWYEVETAIKMALYEKK